MSPFNVNSSTLYIYYNTFSPNVYYKKITNTLIYNKCQLLPYYIHARLLFHRTKKKSSILRLNFFYICYSALDLPFLYTSPENAARTAPAAVNNIEESVPVFGNFFGSFGF